MNQSKMYWIVSDILTSIQRCIRHIFRNPDSLVAAMVLPVVIMILFVVIFGGSINTGTDYVNFVVPGVILICIGYGSSTTSLLVSTDMVGGLFDRFRSLPIMRSSMLIGHVTGSLVRNGIATVLVFVVALAIGFRPNASLLEWLAVVGLLLLFILAISWVSVIFGLIAKSPETAASFSYSIMFLPYFSSGFVETETLPLWLRGFAQYQPITPIIDTLRGLLIGTPIGNSGWSALLWCMSILVISYTTAMYLFERRARE